MQPMAPRGALFQHLADLEQAASRERQLARQRLHQKRSGEILTTYMAFPLNAAKERMAEGMAIGDAVQLVHVTDNEHDTNAIEVRWRVSACSSSSSLMPAKRANRVMVRSGSSTMCS